MNDENYIHLNSGIRLIITHFKVQLGQLCDYGKWGLELGAEPSTTNPYLAFPSPWLVPSWPLPNQQYQGERHQAVAGYSKVADFCQHLHEQIDSRIKKTWSWLPKKKKKKRKEKQKQKQHKHTKRLGQGMVIDTVLENKQYIIAC